MSICLHCFREVRCFDIFKSPFRALHLSLPLQSSRVRLPPQAVQDSSQIDESLRGKWWRPEELG